MSPDACSVVVIYRCLIGKDSVMTARPVPSTGDLPMRIFGMEALAFAFVVSFVARVIRTSLTQSLAGHGKFGLDRP